MHILLNVAQATGIQENSYGWRLVFDKFMFTLTMGLEILLGRYLQQFSIGTGTLHACTSDMEENEEEAAGWRTKGKPEMGWRHVSGRGDSQLSTESLCSVREACWATLLFS